MPAITPRTYDPREFRALTFHDRTPQFRDGTDSPRAYLERCIETIHEREPIVKAFVVLNEDSARAAADASAARWKAGRTLSAIDGMPIGVVVFLLVRIGIGFTVEGVLNFSSPYAIYMVAWIAGFQQNVLYEIIRQMLKIFRFQS